eukprot:CAMPEP_0179917842 /NCGR_PEP_ID=MMETSP0983-20121128/3065_1 /TAXON_ID=483367 /ORGANISM="non described non described, Strain CCMP 2436" /LENGTH=192 /DNA_ID=CAMNT_0021820637 /DNA_START=256 /DNA_END=832 /DNA_ORIENTATION=-
MKGRLDRSRARSSPPVPSAHTDSGRGIRWAIALEIEAGAEQHESVDALGMELGPARGQVPTHRGADKVPSIRAQRRGLADGRKCARVGELLKGGAVEVGDSERHPARGQRGRQQPALGAARARGPAVEVHHVHYVRGWAHLPRAVASAGNAADAQTRKACWVDLLRWWCATSRAGGLVQASSVQYSFGEGRH